MSKFSRNLALIIGINNYGNGISPLKTAVNDAQKIIEIIRKKHGYQVWVCLDKVATLSNLNQLLEKTLPEQVSKNDRLLFYFAGHGVALNGDNGPAGYLIPQDAKQGDTNSYLPMTKLHDALSQLSCRHFLGILDCCFAGAFRWSSTRDLLTSPEVIHQERYDRFITDPAWQIITSSASDQKALDNFDLNVERGQVGNHSPFATALLEALEGAADAYPPAKNGKPAGDGVITATELYLYLRDRVEIPTEKYRLRQTPGIWCLNKHDKGEYIFLTPGHQINLPPAPSLDKSQNPYRGLKSFEEQHSQLFFGRTELIEKLQNFVKTQPLTVVLGASGSGKSSLVKAGLIPKLKQETKDKWCILSPIRPGEKPFQALNNALLRESLPKIGLQNKQKTLAQSIAVWAKHNPNSQLLIFIDQTEEIITLCQDEKQRQEFFRQILIAINAHRHKLRVVLSLRSDFEPQVRDAGLKFVCQELNLRNTLLKNRWQSRRFIVPAMTRGELREAIEKPASARVMYFQPHDLVEQLIDEVADMPGALPLLSFALSELYLKYLKRQREAQYRGITIDRALTQEDYQELGGVIQSLTQRADEEYQGLVEENKAYKRVICHVMLRMVAIAGGELARRRVPLSELEYPPEKNSLVQEVIKRFSQARLLVEGQDAEGNPYVEPAHDALVRGWEKLLAWKQEKEENLILQRRLTSAAEEWKNVKSKEQPSNLQQVKAEPIINWLDCQFNVIENLFNKTNAWINTRLVRLLKRFRSQPSITRSPNQQEQLSGKPKQFLWNGNPYLDVLYEELQSNENWFNQVEAEFVRQSVLQKQKNISWRWRIATAVILSLSGLTITALIGQRDALTSQIKASQQSAEASLQSGQELDALLASLRAAKTLKTKWLLQLLKPNAKLQKDITGTLRTIVYTTREINQWKGIEADIIAFNSQGNIMLAEREKNDNVTLINLSNNSQMSLEGHEGNGYIWDGIAFSPDGNLLATADQKGKIRVWNSKGKAIKEFSEDCFSKCKKKLLFSPDSKQLAIVEYNIGGSLVVYYLKTVSLWNISGSKPKEIEPSQDFDYKNVGFNPNNDLVIAHMDEDRNFLRLSNFETGEQLGYFSGSFEGFFVSSGAEFLVFSPDNKKLIMFSNLADLQTKDFIKKEYSEEAISATHFSRSGKEIANPKQNGAISIIDLKGKLLLELKEHQGAVSHIAFSPNGNQLASIGTDNTVRLWDLGEKQQLVEVTIKPEQIDRIKFSEDRDYITTGQATRDPITGDRLYSTHVEDKHGNLILATSPIDLPAFGESLSSDRMLLASIHDDGIRLWNSSGKQIQLLKFNNDESEIQEIDFSDDGKLLVTKKEDGTVKLWQFEELDELREKGCNLVRDYLQNNPNVEESDRSLC